MTFEQELWKVTLEGIVAAGLIATLGYVFSRSLERFRGSLQYGATLLEERLEAAKDLIDRLHDLRSRHEQLVTRFALSRFETVPREEYEALQNSATDLDRAIAKARLVIDDSVAEAATRARHSAFWFLEHADAARRAVVSDPDPAEGPLSSPATRWLQRLRSEVAEENTRAIEALQIEVHPRDVAIRKLKVTAPAGRVSGDMVLARAAQAS